MSDSNNKFVRYIKRMGAGSMLISIIVHVIIIICATVWVVSSVQPQRKTLFKGGDNGGPTIQHPVKMSNTQPKLDTLTKRLAVDTPNSTVSLPDLPSNADSGLSSPALSSTLGAPGASGGLKGPLMPIFGFKEPGRNGSLIGYLYDLKQTQDLKPNPVFQKMLATLRGIAPYDELQVKEMGGFIQSNWSSTYLKNKFYRSPTPLYATQIFVPDTPSDEAPKAYGAEKTVQPKDWIVHYRSRVSPPVTGTYRFVGGADDVLVVRIDGHLVLDGGIVNVSDFKTDRKEKPNYSYDFTPKNAMGIPYLNQRRGGFVVGHRMDLRAGLFYDLDIVIGESPGGFFFANLLVEQEGVTYAKDAKGNPILPIFRISDTPPLAKDQRTPPYQENGPIWRALTPLQ